MSDKNSSLSSKRALRRPDADPDRPNGERPPCHIKHADRLNGTHVLMEPHPTGERYIEIDEQEVWPLEDLE